MSHSVLKIANIPLYFVLAMCLLSTDVNILIVRPLSKQYGSSKQRDTQNVIIIYLFNRVYMNVATNTSNFNFTCCVDEKWGDKVNWLLEDVIPQHSKFFLLFG